MVILFPSFFHQERTLSLKRDRLNLLTPTLNNNLWISFKTIPLELQL